MTLPNHLTEALKARDEAASDVAGYNLKIKRLEAHSVSASPATRDLAVLREENQIAFAKWSESADGAPPKVDAAREAKLLDEIAAHGIFAASATAAATSLVGRRNEAMKTHAYAGRYAEVAALRHMLETESVTLFAEINSAARVYTDLVARLDRLRGIVVDQAQKLDERELYVAVEHLDKAKHSALVKPDPSADAGEWHAKLAALLGGEKVEDAA
jgi:hypothetical protein